MAEILRVEDLTKYFATKKGTLHAVDGVTFGLREGQTLGIVGESGCGKSTLGRVILHLHQRTGGRIIFQGKDISDVTKAQLKELRKDMQIIFQDPYASLNPRMSIGDIIAEPLKIYKLCNSKEEQQKKVREIMDVVGLAERTYGLYPHELDGGRRQRVGIARALILDPKLVVCDEPVSALDVSIQAQVVNMLEDLQREFGLTYLFIAHDLSMVRHISNRIGVMYLGKLVEVGDSEEIYQNHLHPYTEALLSSVPLPDPELAHRSEPIMLQGDIPSPIDPPSGCRFRTRCPYATQLCAEQEPPLTEVGSNHAVACHRVTPARGNEEKGGIL